ncbi:hypothetical protein C8Q76DRAFT_629889 [Earliella scabrosa]|nr:hypothetical protein C8Q76DRAFT_629889 [Earliella scabrosa]
MNELQVWRHTSKTLYTHATGALRRFLIVILSHFFPFPCTFLRHLTRCRAIIAGLAAVSFILRDRSIRPSKLEVYVSKPRFNDFVRRLTTCAVNSHHIRRTVQRTLPSAYSLDRNILTYTTLYLKNGRRIVIYQSADVSACSPLARTTNSALFTFITEHTFGCAYAPLTLRRQSLLSDMRLRDVLDIELEAISDLLKAGFSLGISPSTWPEYPITIDNFPPPHEHDTHPCFRQYFVCPFQGRYFGDGGTLMGYMDPLGRTAPTLRRLGIPPFGAMMAWRLHTSFTCADICDVIDDVLPDHIVAMPLIVVPDPFPATNHDFRRVSDPREAPTTTIQNTTAHRQRSRSLSL